MNEGEGQGEGRGEEEFQPLSEVVWQRDLPLRYALISEEWDGEQTVWARCVDVEGLFQDRADYRERLTLKDCAPTGRLRKAAERCAEGRPVPFGDLNLMVNDLDAEDEYEYDYAYCEFEDVVIVDSRPSTEASADPADPALLDLVVECIVTGAPRPSHKEPARADVGLLNGTSGLPLGRCGRVEGLYRDRPGPDRPPVRLIGCEPSPHLLRRLVQARHGGDSLQLWLIDRTGRPTAVQEHINVDVDECRPSAMGGALIDVTLKRGLFRRVLPPLEARPVWEAWHEGRPRERSTWARFPTAGRAAWLGFAETCLGPEEPGAVCEMDGRYITDVPGLHCALGEAIGGPGRTWHQCWSALRGCQCGGEIHCPPFTLVWHDADVARRALADVSEDTDGELNYFDAVVGFLERLGITVELR
ncbi:hypothetical protein ACGFMM_32285 [Streptomyces sp. NPDC048604]|uniref:hypothetical protein n=1 Tax=Streptomyces sp. NPDC048604 TaxID=3365578 RepID=UPI00371B51F9